MRRRRLEHWCAAAILAAVICVAFGDIVFLGRTLLASNYQFGTMRTGAYGYKGRQVGCAFHGVWVCGIWLVLFAREVGIGFAGSLVAGVCFGLSGHFIYYINMPDLDTQIWLPALLLVTKRLSEKPTYRAFAITTALVALIILAGMPESAFFMFLLATLYLLFCLWQLAPEKRHEKQWWQRPPAAFAGAGTAGLLISLPQVLPFVEYLRNALNPRAPGVGMEHAAAGTIPTLAMGSFFGNLYAAWNGALRGLVANALQ